MLGVQDDVDVWCEGVRLRLRQCLEVHYTEGTVERRQRKERAAMEVTRRPSHHLSSQTSPYPKKVPKITTSTLWSFWHLTELGSKTYFGCVKVTM